MNTERKINYLVGNSKIERISSVPYNEEVLSFLTDLSSELNNSKYSKEYPDIKTLSFFLRKASLLNLQKKYLNSNSETRLGLGLVFHITPSNMPTNFFYSLIFGLLTGNSNIVKVPSKNFVQVDIICNLIKKLISKKHNGIKNLIKIVKYTNHEKYTKEFSSNCDARIVWGGDKTIKEVRKFEINPRSSELTFSDRYSICLVESEKFLKLNKTKKKLLALKFYNDTFVADQNACSSPHLILWLGKNIKKAKLIFWNLLNDLVKIKYDLTEVASIEKYTELCKKLAIDSNIKNFKTFSSNVYTVNLKSFKNDMSTYRGRWGFFYEQEIKNINSLKKIISKKFQTLTYFGIEKKILKKFIIDNKINGIDRVVPIGQGLDINFFWDGYDINKVLTRVIDIK